MVTILIVDDHQLFREGLRFLLELQEDFGVIGEAHDGKEAISLVSRHKPDIVILDIEMPEMGGIEAAHEIKKINPDTKILALSRHSERRYVSDIFEAGASGYMLKDSAGDELINAIRVVISGNKYCSPELVGIVLDDYSERLTKEKTSRLALLSPREKEVLIHIAEGRKSKEIADILFVSKKTIDTHRLRIMQKLEMNNITDLIRFAIREGLIDL